MESAYPNSQVESFKPGSWDNNGICLLYGRKQACSSVFVIEKK